MPRQDKKNRLCYQVNRRIYHSVEQHPQYLRHLSVEIGMGISEWRNTMPIAHFVCMHTQSDYEWAVKEFMQNIKARMKETARAYK